MSSDEKISEITALGAAPASDDLVAIVDSSTSSTKRLTIANLFTSPTFTTPTLGVASATSISLGNEALSHYDEGSWTPSLVASGGGAPTHGTQLGAYTRIGNICHIFGRLSISDVGTLSGALSIAGLPFANATGTQYLGGMAFGRVLGLSLATDRILAANFNSGSTEVSLIDHYNTSSSTIGHTEIANNFDIRFTAVYQVA